MVSKVKSKGGFTLIELLVVIAIIAILAAILFPVFAQAREKARETTCVSNMRQIGLGVRMYVQDYDETFPLFYAYNTKDPVSGVSAKEGEPLHLGVEVLIFPYIKNKQIFRCPNDQGGPSVADPDYGCPGRPNNYQACYGSSYRFSRCSFSNVANVSHQNNFFSTTTSVASDAAFAVPAETRMMRDEMYPWFGTMDKYGYRPSYYQQWHPRGGGTVFADGHAKFTVNSGQFDQQVVSLDGGRSGDVDPGAPANGNGYGTYYGLCD